MYHTLFELYRIHKAPMVVRDGYTHTWYLILGPQSEGAHTFEAKRLEPNRFSAVPGQELLILYGGYSRWVYIGPEQKQGISYEDQQRNKQALMKKQNDRIVKDLKRTGSRSAKKPEPPKDRPVESKVIPFIPRPKKDS